MSGTLIPNLTSVNSKWSNAERPDTPAIDSITPALSRTCLQNSNGHNYNWDEQEQASYSSTKLHCIYHLVAIYPTNLLVPSDSRTRQYTHSHSYRHIHTSLDSYKYSFYPKTIVQWNLLPAAAVQCPTLDSFKEQIPLSVLQQHI